MKTCSLCHEEVTPRMVRQGAAISRGSELYHRECHRSFRPGSVPGPAKLPAPETLPEAAVGQLAPHSPEALQYASFWRRVGAQVIDSVILNALLFFVLVLMGRGPRAAGPAQPGPVWLALGLVGAVLPLVYYVWFCAKKGATPGKAALGIRIVGEGHRRPTGLQSSLRAIGYSFSFLLFGLGFLWMLWDAEKRCWHDMIAGTRVIRA